jgi:hypothetical protein
MCLRAAPSGAPKLEPVEALSSSTIKVTWHAPDLDKQNGALLHYNISLREIDDNSSVGTIFGEPQQFHFKIPHSDRDTYSKSIKHLRPFTKLLWV